MHVRSRTGRIFDLPTPEDETEIRAGMVDDPDVCELSDEQLQRLHPMSRPQAKSVKQSVSVRLSEEVVTYFKATGNGWQTRMDEVLKDYVRSVQRQG